MLFSRNPDTGELESYTDDGIFTGHVFTMGDFIQNPEIAKDGGPGSGNFGHKGRPGQVGGSGEGGGSVEKSASSSAISAALESRTQNVSMARERTTPQNMHRQFQLFARHMNGIMYGQGKGHEAAHAYNWHGDVLMNNLLRKGKPRSFEQQEEWLKEEAQTREHIENLTETISNNKLARPAVVFRGVETKDGLAKMLGIDTDAKGMEEMLANPNFAQSLIGQTFSDPAFCSTSIDPEVPRKAGFSKACEMEIYCPEGTQGVYLGDQARITDEHEYIMQRGTQFVVTGAEVVKNGFGVNRLKLQVAVVSQEPKEMPKAYEIAFKKPREEIKAAVGGEQIDSGKLKKMFPKVPPETIDEIQKLRQEEKSIENYDRIWEITAMQSDLGNIDPTEASEIESYAMNLDRFKDSDSYRRQAKETQEKKEKMKSPEFDAMRSEIQKEYPDVPEDQVPLLMIYREEAERLEKKYDHDVNAYGESFLTKKIKKKAERVRTQEKELARQMKKAG